MKTTVIDGKQYREVSRKANVGELVLITNSGDIPLGVYTCTRNDQFKDASIDIDCAQEKFVDADIDEYVVLEPVEAADELRALVDGLTQSVASLTLRVTELERNVYGRYTPPELVSKPKLKTRDEIVEQAKKDVRELSRTPRDVYGCHPHFWPKIDGEKTSWFPIQRVDFMVNHEKRTVVVLIRSISSKTVFARGIAKCAPDDCFNAHIGRAIALRRALGLTVPIEYYEASQPESVRVGDVVKWTALYDSSRTEIHTLMRIEGEKYWLSDGCHDIASTLVTIDDSREEVSA